MHLAHRIADRRMLRLICKWLTAGGMEQGQHSRSDVGSPQGAVILPLLSNIYLHYVFDLWVQQWRTRRACGDMIISRYADDTVLGFEHRFEADLFLADLKDRAQAFGLSLHPEKTRLIAFSRFANAWNQRHGRRKAETFDCLSFCTSAPPRMPMAGLSLNARRWQSGYGRSWRKSNKFCAVPCTDQYLRQVDDSMRSYAGTSITMLFRVI